MPKGGKAGWIAFALGMLGMFVVMALWVVLIELARDPAADAEFVSRPQSAEEGEVVEVKPISDYR